MPTQEYLRARHDYNPDTGEYVSKKTNKPMGTLNYRGALRTTIKGKSYFVHRLIWIWMTGEIPEDKQVDHIDRNPSNNQWSNLRLADATENCWNRLSCVPTSGYRGVYKLSKSPTFFAQIFIQGERIYLGTYPTAEEASAAYETKAQECFGEYFPIF